MNNTMTRLPYTAPSAELICLAPDTPIANSSWTWKDGSNISDGTNHWGVDFNGLNPSVTGAFKWLDDNNENPDLM